MKGLFAIVCAIACIAAAMPGKSLAYQMQAPATPPQQSTPPKKPEKPIDPDSTAGVRGPHYTLQVKLLRKGRPQPGAHVAASYADGFVAASCDANEKGLCILKVGPGDYRLSASYENASGGANIHLTAAPPLFVIRLAEAKSPIAASPR